LSKNFTAKSGWASEDSAFGSADPTPTHKPKLDFNEDPFSNHRYGDPFELEGADPFKNSASEDPFTATVDAAFGSTVSLSRPAPNPPPDPFNAWGSDKDDSFSQNTLDDSFDPFSAKNLRKNKAEDSFSRQDPFSKKTEDPFKKITEDPFSKSTEDPFKDPFGSSSAWGAGAGGVATDPFSAVPAPVSRSKTFNDDAFKEWRPPPNKSINQLQKSETFVSSSQSLSRPWASPVDTSTTSIPRNRPSRPPALVNNNLNHLDLNVDKKEKSTKNNLKIFKPSFMKKDKKSKSGTGASAPPPLEEANVKMASEASKKAEKERLERLRLQEQQDLAYAIALSKAEAASLSSDK